VQIVQEQSSALIALCEEQEIPFSLPWSRVLHGWSMTLQQRTEAGIDQMRQGMDAFQKAGVGLLGPYHRILLAEAYGAVNKPTAGLATLTEAEHLMQQTRERF
jgi:hypothetical protein